MIRSASRRRRHTVARTTGLLACLILLWNVLGAQVKTDFTITMTDGVSLEATLLLPDSGKPAGGFPTILLVHGYGGSKNEWDGVDSYLTSLGYGCLAYSARGQGNSGGLSTTMGPREQLDLLEVVQHLRTLPGVDPERLAVAGASQGGVHAWMAAVSNLPGVKAVAALMATPSFSLDMFPGGCVKQQLCFELTLGSIRYDPIRDRVRDFVVQDNYDSLLAYGLTRDLEHLLDSVQVPVIQCVGWADWLFPANGAIRAAERLSARGSPIWSCYVRFGHNDPTPALVAEYMYVIQQIIVPWFDRWVRFLPLDRSDIPLVYYLDDRPTWNLHESTVWPPQPGGMIRFYLSDTAMTTVRPQSSTQSTFTLLYDSAYTPARGWSERYTGGPFTDAFHATTTRFVSDPAADTTEITGIPLANLWLSSTVPQFQSHVRLCDVAPSDTGLVWSVISRGTNGVRGYAPGIAFSCAFECAALSHLLLPGHRLGVEITSLDMYNAVRPHVIPYFLSSSSTVLSSPARPSYVDIPFVGNAGFVSVPPAISGLPGGIMLEQNYPNPFNPTTSIRYGVGVVSREGVVATGVRLVVYDLLGREVAVLVDGQQRPGRYQVEFDGSRLATGVYFCRLSAGGYVETRRMALVR